MIAGTVIFASALCLTVQSVLAQNVDIDALIEAIDSRSGQYDELIGILQGTDTTHALAAFDIMMENGQPTLTEVAVASALSATDERLRARALWKVLASRDSMTIAVQTDDLGEEARAALDEWNGAQRTWGLLEKFPETQCIKLATRKTDCYPGYSITVSGLHMDMAHSNSISGQFDLDPAGRLVGSIINMSTSATYPATIDLR